MKKNLVQRVNIDRASMTMYRTFVWFRETATNCCAYRRSSKRQASPISPIYQSSRKPDTRAAHITLLRIINSAFDWVFHRGKGFATEKLEITRGWTEFLNKWHRHRHRALSRSTTVEIWRCSHLHNSNVRHTHGVSNCVACRGSYTLYRSYFGASGRANWPLQNGGQSDRDFRKFGNARIAFSSMH